MPGTAVNGGGGGGQRLPQRAGQRPGGPANKTEVKHEPKSAESRHRPRGAGGGGAAAAVGAGGTVHQAAKIEYKIDADPADTRRLLILDINGVLVCREPFVQARKQRGYTKRPHCDAFLDWAFEHFQVGVWSCGRPENMELELFEGRKLALVFSQEHSANLWPRHSVVSPGKPLFLKDLAKVWDNSGGLFSKENTLLVGACACVPLVIVAVD